MSPSTDSNFNKKIYAKMEAWRNRPIERPHTDAAELGRYACVSRGHIT
jgi:hypothetical protein